MTSNIRGSSICSPKSLYKKTSYEILGEWKAAFKTGASKIPRLWPVLPSLLRPICQVCLNSQLSPTPAVATNRKEEEEGNKTNFSSCNDRSAKWIINDYYIFFPNLRVWVFLFLRTPFFKTQHVGPMLQVVTLPSRVPVEVLFLYSLLLLPNPFWPWLSWLRLQYTPAFLHMVKTSSKNLLCMTLNSLMMRLQ